MMSYTDLNQSKILSKILLNEGADMCYQYQKDRWVGEPDYKEYPQFEIAMDKRDIPCWSLAALVKCLSKIKPQVYTPILFPSESKWILQFAEYGHGNVCEVSCDNPIDACYEMIINLHELKLL